MENKRLMFFSYSNQYESNGANGDYVGRFNTFEEINNEIKNNKDISDHECFNIYDVKTDIWYEKQITSISNLDEFIYEWIKLS